MHSIGNRARNQGQDDGRHHQDGRDVADVGGRLAVAQTDVVGEDVELIAGNGELSGNHADLAD